MKTLEEVKKYVSEVGHTDKGIYRICGFLIGAGLKGIDEEMQFQTGEDTFVDFYKWFNSEEKSKIDWDSEFKKGDFIHIDKNNNVIVLSDIKDATFVGTDGFSIGKYTATDESRPCYEDEIELLKASLRVNELLFNHDTDSIEVDCSYKEALNDVLESFKRLFSNA